jgi:hypothetical protein
MVMLCVTADGQKLPPYISSTKAIPNDEYMPVNLMEDWVKSVWEKCPGVLYNQPHMLAFYIFRGVLSEELKVKHHLCDDCPEVVTSDINQESSSVPAYSEAVKSVKTLWQFL